MTTAHDLTLIALGLPPDLPVEQGDLSLALAGAEAIDLLESGTLTLSGDRVVPGLRAATGDRLLDVAVASSTWSEPYETIEDWLWRRGRDLAAVYVDDLARSGLVMHPRKHRFQVRSGRTVLVDSPARSHAEERRASGEPVLTALIAETGIGGDSAEPAVIPAGDAVATVLAAVGDAVTRLEALRLRRDMEDAAFDNIWRG